MNAFLLGLYGIFFVIVSSQMNANKLFDETRKDMKGFIPWAIAIAALAIMTEFEGTEKLVKPLVVLLVLNFVLLNYDTVVSEFRKISGSPTK